MVLEDFDEHIDDSFQRRINRRKCDIDDSRTWRIDTIGQLREDLRVWRTSNVRMTTGEAGSAGRAEARFSYGLAR